jgi:cell division inhibitor SulA
MFTSAHANRSSLTSASVRRPSHDVAEQPASGLISEIVYREDQPMMTHYSCYLYYSSLASSLAGSSG